MQETRLSLSWQARPRYRLALSILSTLTLALRLSRGSRNFFAKKELRILGKLLERLWFERAILLQLQRHCSIHTLHTLPFIKSDGILVELPNHQIQAVCPLRLCPLNALLKERIPNAFPLVPFHDCDIDNEGNYPWHQNIKVRNFA